MMTQQPQSKFYRLSTILKSLKAIYKLSPQQVNNFMKAYEIYDCDWVNGKAIKNNHTIEYSEVKQKIIDWYSVLNHLCAIGVVEKMYIPPTLNPKAGVIKNQLLYEESFANDLGIKKGDKILELGCGKGRVAAHIAAITGGEITGINIDQVQLDNANLFVKQNRLSDQCKFLNADFNDLPLPFPDNYFNHAYEIQALSLSRNLEKLFNELNRVLKPNGRLALTEWVRLPNYNPNNAHHAELMKRVKPLIGAIGTPSPIEYEKALHNAGFKVLKSADPSVNKSQEILVDKAGAYFDKIVPMLRMLAKVKILPAHIPVLFDRLGKDVDALCEADRLGLVAMSYQFIAEKTG